MLNNTILSINAKSIDAVLAIWLRRGTLPSTGTKVTLKNIVPSSWALPSMPIYLLRL